MHDVAVVKASGVVTIRKSIALRADRTSPRSTLPVEVAEGLRRTTVALRALRMRPAVPVWRRPREVPPATTTKTEPGLQESFI